MSNAQGPNGEKRSADPVVSAVTVMKVATGQIQESRGKGSLTPEQRREVVRQLRNEGVFD